ncbi:hypothetical protein H310_04251 [Aphanomyces invadans]|uniref:Uncharacterized protein n=1 Tax=Aphanomyces invadans TaxID=157072 RepID=A0A024UI55_9STRA|nr:hypothetical protein H310_04251 [Aphanomyces invadans]ETW05298.1 hypothetical protein H310_04251 [Aphanomyces invadans]|eukprot:XP_008866736.1 hypothetical protein H310_04251 [Aphanomyces invadans]
METVAETQRQQLMAQHDASVHHADSLSRQEIKVEGLKMPKYYGKFDESISLFIHQVTTYFHAKNIDPT